MINLSLWLVLSVSYLKYFSLPPRSWSYSPILSSGSVTALHWDQKPKMNWSILYMVFEVEIKFCFFPTWISKRPGAVRSKHYPSPTALQGCLSLKWSIYICMGYFLAFYFIPFVSLPILAPTPHIPNYCGFYKSCYPAVFASCSSKLSWRVSITFRVSECKKRILGFEKIALDL